MALPGFTAEHSLGPTVQTYRMADYYGIAGADYLSPQQYVEDVDVEDMEGVADETDMEAVADEMDVGAQDIEEETLEEASVGEEV
jgi:hypothetical protein